MPRGSVEPDRPHKDERRAFSRCTLPPPAGRRRSPSSRCTWSNSGSPPSRRSRTPRDGFPCILRSDSRRRWTPSNASWTRGSQPYERRTTTDGALRLHLAAGYGSFDLVTFLARTCPRALEEKTRAGRLPLHVAVRSRSLEVVQFLVGAGPHALHERSADGLLPVHLAASSDAPLEVLHFLARARPEFVGRILVTKPPRHDDTREYA
jgi:Ankyrin repeats (3 copies)